MITAARDAGSKPTEKSGELHFKKPGLESPCMSSSVPRLFTAL
jgi:hypothetical protein